MSEEIETTEPVEADNSGLSSEASSEEPVYTVKVDGDEQEVTLSELQNGYQRQADYTRKTQQVAAEKERFAASRSYRFLLWRMIQRGLLQLWLRHLVSA